MQPSITDLTSAGLKRESGGQEGMFSVVAQFPHRSVSCCSLLCCSGLLSRCWAELSSSTSITLFCGDVTRVAWPSLLAFWEPAEEEPVLSLSNCVVNVSSPSLVLTEDPPNRDPDPRRSRILKMSSDKVPLLSSELSWMRLQRLRASALAAIPVRGQLKAGRVWVRLRGLPCQWSEDGDEGLFWGL